MLSAAVAHQGKTFLEFLCRIAAELVEADIRGLAVQACKRLVGFFQTHGSVRRSFIAETEGRFAVAVVDVRRLIAFAFERIKSGVGAVLPVSATERELSALSADKVNERRRIALRCVFSVAETEDIHSFANAGSLGGGVFHDEEEARDRCVSDFLVHERNAYADILSLTFRLIRRIFVGGEESGIGVEVQKPVEIFVQFRLVNFAVIVFLGNAQRP